MYLKNSVIDKMTTKRCLRREPYIAYRCVQYDDNPPEIVIPANFRQEYQQLIDQYGNVVETNPIRQHVAPIQLIVNRPTAPHLAPVTGIVPPVHLPIIANQLPYVAHRQAAQHRTKKQKREGTVTLLTKREGAGIYGGRSSIQSVLFDRQYYTKDDALQWIAEHDMVPIDVKSTKRYIHVGIHDPSMYQRIRTKNTGKGIKFHIGFY